MKPQPAGTEWRRGVLVGRGDQAPLGLSVDVEEWYHGLTSTSLRPESWPDLPGRVEATTDATLELMEAAGVRATFFVLGVVAVEHPGIVRAIVDQGHELASHGCAHRLVTSMRPDEFQSDAARSKALLEDIGGCPVLGFRAPAFSIREHMAWALDALIDCGYVYDASFLPFRTPLGGSRAVDPSSYTYEGTTGRLPRIAVATTVLRWPLGGFFLRILPERLLGPALDRAIPGTSLYFHPWELEVGRLQFGSIRELVTHYLGRAGAHRKWKLVVQRGNFVPLREFVT